MEPERLKIARRRQCWLLLGLLVFGAWVGWSFFEIQVVRHDRYLAAAQRQQKKRVEIPPERGTIAGLEQQLASLERLANDLHGQPEALLDLLRRLEQLHRSIQDGPFRNSLPADRNDLFRLLAEMERSGGWPYIPRLQLRTFMDLLQRDAALPLPADEGEQPLAA